MKINQEIQDLENDENWITVVIWVYRRWLDKLKEMLEAFENQTIKPREIRIVQDWNLFEVPNEIKEKYKYFQSSKNVWVWFRFTLWLIARTKYLCYQDDDSIPWSKWLENCMTEIKKENWIYWTIGCVMWVTKWSWAKNRWEPETRKENYYSHTRYWRANPNEKTVEVDLIGHSWFFERSLLSECFKTPLLPQFRMCWEDMELWFAIQRLGWKIFVPPHPKNDLEMRGSLKAWEYWIPLSSRATHQWWDWDPYDTYRKYLRQRGFKVVSEK